MVDVMMGIMPREQEFLIWLQKAFVVVNLVTPSIYLATPHHPPCHTHEIVHPN
jgi:hypothetical protein